MNNTLADYFQMKRNMCDETAATSIELTALNDHEDLMLSPEIDEAPGRLIQDDEV